MALVRLFLFGLLLLVIGCDSNDSDESPALLTAQPAQKNTLAAPTPLPTPTRADTTRLRGRIAFDYEFDIWVMNADGSGRTRLTDHPAEDFDAAWSPDGTRIAFRSHRDGNDEVYVMNADGSDQTNISRSPSGDYSPVWSPDGSLIAFMSARAGKPDIWLMAPDGSNPVQLTDVPGISEYPSWSPDGSQIAFHCTFGRTLSSGTGDFEICVVNADGTGLQQLTEAAGVSKLPDWSPDGSQILFESDRDGWPTLPQYEPEGYDQEAFGDQELYVMNADGSMERNMTNEPRAGDSMPSWSLSGEIVFSRYGCLVVIDPDGSNPVQVTSGPCGDAFPDWSVVGP